jgi:hypothetical protein
VKKKIVKMLFFFCYFVNLSSFTSSLSSSTNLSRLTGHGHDDDVDDNDKMRTQEDEEDKKNIKINENDNHVDFDFFRI